jgi:hypothetical protein
LADPYIALEDVENHVDPAMVKSKIVVAFTTVLAASYPDILASDVCVTLVLPVHATVSDKDGDELKDVGCVILAV